MQALLSHNAYVDAQDDVCVCVCVFGCMMCIYFLFICFFYSLYFLQDGTTALMRAAWEGNTAIVETLLSNKPNINLKDNVCFIFYFLLFDCVYFPSSPTMPTLLFGYFQKTGWSYSLNSGF